MGKFLYKLEKKFGRFAIPNLPLIMIMLYAIGYVMSLISPSVLYRLSLNPYEIIHNFQIWRIFTWVIVPPDRDNIFYMLLALYFYYSIGTSLERTWGKFLFNLYTFSGLLFTLLCSFGIYGYFAIRYAGQMGSPYMQQYFMVISALFFTSYYINMSIFLAFAATYPDSVVYLFFVLPIKVKALGIIYVLVMFYDAFSTITKAGPEFGIIQLVVILASLLNFAIFFFATRQILKTSRIIVKRAVNKAKENAPRMKPENKIAKHRCAVCGQTSEDNPDLSFRFCSKCNGNYEYCQNHLFTHTHK